ncbi:hypothetical protein B0H19DRAFT_1294878, partial [Mycena capillaripes]
SRKVQTTKPVTGPPQALVSRIEHFQDLLRHLPATLDENPTHSLYRFSIDPEILKQGGHFSAVGHALEVSFETDRLRLQGRPMLFIERGRRLDDLVKMLKIGVKYMSPGERTTFQEAWLERLIAAAVDSGAKIPSKKRKAAAQSPATDDSPPASKRSRQTIIVIDDDDNLEKTPSPLALPPSSAAPSTSSQPSTSRDIIVGNSQQRTLGSLGWQKAKPGEVSAYWAKVKADGAERRETVLAAQRKKVANKQEHERDLARLRQQRRCEKMKKEKADEEPELDSVHNAHTVLMQGADALAHSSTIPDVASLSRPATQAWKKHRVGTQGGAVQGKATKVFWFDPFLWAIIEPVIRRCGWSAAKTVQELHRAHPVLFNGPNNKLHRATVWKWIVKGEKRFTDAALRNIANRRSLAGTGRTGILTPYPAIVEEIVTTLKGLRVSGCVVNVHIARSIMIAIIGKHRPQLLDSFSCLENYVRTFLDSTLNWTSRKATRAAKHIAENASELCERTFFRLAHAIEHQDIPAKLIINYDQTGVYIHPNSSQTFELRGSKQVSTSGNDEKRAYTLGVASDMSGGLLPLEQVWAGMSKGSLPTADADGYQEAIDRGFHFTFAASKKRTSHFSTEKTMEELIEFVIQPHVAQVIADDPDLDEDQKCLFYVDIYPVHTSKPFRTFVFDKQDVGIQRVAKHHLRQSQLNYLVHCHQQQIAEGITPENVKFSSSYPVLRNASVCACVDLYDWLTSPDGRNIVKRSWEMCVVPGKPEYNLSPRMPHQPGDAKGFAEIS